MIHDFLSIWQASSPEQQGWVFLACVLLAMLVVALVCECLPLDQWQSSWRWYRLNAKRVVRNVLPPVERPTNVVLLEQHKQMLLDEHKRMRLMSATTLGSRRVH